ncbi:MAG: hypothetical protein KC589_00205 [Nanoarchaeota archaeon]|nr:hypothetical protein [Nanoarchaeota archaeon]
MAVNFLAKIQLIFSNPNSFFESVKSDESTNNSIIVSFPFIVIAYGFLILTLVQKEAISSGMGMFLFFWSILIIIPLLMFSSFIIHHILVKPFGGLNSYKKLYKLCYIPIFHFG